MQPKIFHRASNILGEGPLWHPFEQVLYWVDIEACKIFRLELASGASQSFDTPTRPGALAAAAEGGVYVALETGLAYLNPQTQQLRYGAQPLRTRKDVRFNDGKCDKKGRFWVGSLDLAETNPIGALYRFDDFQQANLVAEGFTVSNGLGWNVDDTRMYFTDSAARTIYRYQFDIETGRIFNPEPFIQFTPQQGYPDGLCVDSEGFIWVCHWDGWRITRFNPQGEVDQVISVPVPRPTCCTFGGPGLNLLFITSARRDLSDAALEAAPHSGDIFVIETEFKGMPAIPMATVSNVSTPA